MLIEFSVANYRSIKDRQTLSLVKGNGDEHAETNVMRVGDPQSFSLVRSAAIYGANAAGKTNFIRALGAMKKTVLESASTQQRGDTFAAAIPFRLDREARSQPSEFEAIILVDGVRYQYGFAIDEQRVYEEWLFAFPKGHAQSWVHRSWDQEREIYQWKKCSALSGKKQLWQESTRENSLFLSTAVQLNSKQLEPVFDWFNKTLKIAGISGWGTAYSGKLCEQEEKESVISFLQSADIDIDDILVKREKFSTAVLPDDMPSELKELIIAEMGNKESVEIQVARKDIEGRLAFFDMNKEESAGTRGSVNNFV